MTPSQSFAADRAEHPVDVVERLAALNDWAFDRADEDEISILVSGVWTQYEVAFTWLPDIESLHVGCSFDLKIPARRRAEIATLAQMINEQLWIGHFDVWMQNGMVMFRHALLLAGGVPASGRQCEASLGCALDACERYFPAFQFVVWAGKSAREAMESAMFETSGEA